MIFYYKLYFIRCIDYAVDCCVLHGIFTSYELIFSQNLDVSGRETWICPNLTSYVFVPTI
jgi:hypothetical protein